jgi:hypothetical protein
VFQRLQFYYKNIPELINYRPHLTIVRTWLLKSYLKLTFTCMNNESYLKLKTLYPWLKRILYIVTSLRILVRFPLNMFKCSRVLHVPHLCTHRMTPEANGRREQRSPVAARLVVPLLLVSTNENQLHFHSLIHQTTSS